MRTTKLTIEERKQRHRDRMRVSRALLRVVLRANGICTNCAKRDADEGSIRCEECKAWDRARQKQLRRERNEQSIRTKEARAI